MIATPAAWPLAIVPVAIAGGVGGVLSALSIWLVPAKVAAWIDATSALGQAGAWLVSVLATLLAVVLSVLVGLAVAQPLAGPALDAIVRRASAQLGAPAWPPTRFLDDVVRGVGSLALTSAFGLPILALLFVVNFAFPPATIVTVPLKIAVCALVVAWDLCDYPLSLRGVGLRARVRFARRHALALVGFGACLAVVALVPFAILLVLPAGVAGAAKLTLHLERYDESRGLKLE